MELFWNTLPAQEWGNVCISVLVCQSWNHRWRAITWQRCVRAVGPEGHIHRMWMWIFCLFKFLCSVTGNPRAILRGDVTCTFYKCRNRGKGSIAQHGMCQDTKSVTVCVCWVLIHVLTPAGCALPQWQSDGLSLGSAEGGACIGLCNCEISCHSVRH